MTGGGRGVGRAIVERLLGDGGVVVAIELDPDALAWTGSHPAGERVVGVAGDAADEAVTGQAADLAEAAAPLAGWVNNAAVFRDASIDTDPAATVLELIGLNLAPAVVGCATAVRRFLAAGGGGAIVNVSSHQARRAVPGALPYVVAKAATEGLTRALAVDYGPAGVRVNTVALGSIDTERYRALLAGLEPEAADRVGTRWPPCTRSAGSGGPRRWRPWSPTCCRRRPASSTGPPSRWTAAALSWPVTPRPAGPPSGGRGGPGSSGGRPRPARSCRRGTGR